MIVQRIIEDGWVYEQTPISDLRNGMPFYPVNPLETHHNTSPDYVGLTKLPEDTLVWTCYATPSQDNVALKPQVYHLNDTIEFTHGKVNQWRVTFVRTYPNGDQLVTARNVRKNGDIGLFWMQFSPLRPNSTRSFGRVIMI